MNKSSQIIGGVIVIALIAAGAWVLISNNSTQPVNTPTPPAANQNSQGNEEELAAVTITYSDTGVSLSAKTMKSGEKVKVINQSQKTIDVSSNPHPVHTDNSELNAGDIEPGGSRTFTLTTKGEWAFHDHYDPSKGGTIKVE